MYLLDRIQNARVLIAVKTYPVPSAKYDELVCNAGFLENGKWIRVYPVKFQALPYDQQYSNKTNGIDFYIVGRGITQSDNIKKESEYCITAAISRRRIDRYL